MGLSGTDIFFTGTGDEAADRAVRREHAAGRLKRVVEGFYVDTSLRDIPDIVFAKWAPILAHYFPDAVLSGRTALRLNPDRTRGPDGRPAYPGYVFATHAEGAVRRVIELPGLVISSVRGPGPLDGDVPYLGVRIPSHPRKLLDNLKPSRARNGPSRTAGREAVELEVERILAAEGEDGLRTIRARAQEIASRLDAEEEFRVLADIVGTVLGTRQAKLASKGVSARSRGRHPYDPDCMERLKILADTLGRVTLPEVPDPHAEPAVAAGTAFVEAYFTNFIEGTRFLVDKARRIVFDGEEADGRPADGRDVTQTFAQVSRFARGDASASSYEEFEAEIRERNRMLMAARPENAPGEFKEDANRAGNTVFTLPHLVEGTLREGFAMLKGIRHPLARGLFTHTLLVLVHPFNDGNGRTARIMMTKELVSAGQCRIVVPTIFRNDYIGALRALSGEAGPTAAPLVRAAIRCQSTTSRIADPDIGRTIELWATTHAFLEDERNARLTEPSSDARVEWRKGIPAPASYWAELDLEAQLADGSDAASLFGR